MESRLNYAYAHACVSPSLPSIAVINTIIKCHLGRKGLVSSCTSWFTASPWWQAGRTWRNTAYWLAHSSTLAYLSSHATLVRLPKVDHIQRGWAFPWQSVLDYKIVPWTNCLLNCNCLFSSDSSLYRVNQKPNETSVLYFYATWGAKCLASTEDSPEAITSVLLIGQKDKTIQISVRSISLLFLCELDLCFILGQRHHHFVATPTNISIDVIFTSHYLQEIGCG